MLPGATMFPTECRSPAERRLFPIVASIAALGWIVVLLLFNIYLPCVGLFAIAAHALALASVRGRGVRVTEAQLPDLHRRVTVAAQALGLETVPETWVMQADGTLNAYATKLFSRTYIVLYSDLVDAAAVAAEGRTGDGGDELDFVIAHELGHLAAGHLKWLTFLLPARALPWLGPAWSRACEYTADRCGHFRVADVPTSCRALAVLATGGRLARLVDLDALASQRRESGDFWMTVQEVNASHPSLPNRIGVLRQDHQIGPTPDGSMNPIAALLAPIFGGIGSGGGGFSGLMVTVAVIGILAAIAIPNFVAMQLKAKRGEVPGYVDGIRSAEIAYQGTNGAYLACGAEGGATALLGKQPHDWKSDPANDCFSKLGWQPDGPLRGTYWVQVSDTDFVVYGACDVDGDGNTAKYGANLATVATRITEDNVY